MEWILVIAAVSALYALGRSVQMAERRGTDRTMAPVFIFGAMFLYIVWLATNL